jgi:hypothetical protein
MFLEDSERWQTDLEVEGVVGYEIRHGLPKCSTGKHVIVSPTDIDPRDGVHAFIEDLPR